jgi:hypothetical protein
VFAAHGHDVRLMSPEYVRPYIKACEERQWRCRRRRRDETASVDGAVRLGTVRQHGTALEHEAIKIERALSVMTYRSGKRELRGRARYGT